MTSTTPVAVLLLADGRFPTGGHAHSGGVEAAVLAGLVHDVPSLAAFLDGRLHTVGLVDAALSAAATMPDADLLLLDAEAAARIPSPAQRAASRAQSAGLARAARAAWPSALNRSVPSRGAQCATRLGTERVLDTDVGGLMYPVALGSVAGAVGVSPEEAARVACHHAVMGPAGAAVRLLGLDPFAAHGAVAALGSAIDDVVAEATQLAVSGDLARLPAVSGVVPELAADAHAVHPEALFAS